MIISSPARIWHDVGPTTCTSCKLVDRCVYMTIEGQRGEFCSACFRSRIGPHIRAALASLASHPPTAANDVLAFMRSQPQGALQDALRAMQLRLFYTSADAKTEGLASLEGAIRDRCDPLVWILPIAVLTDQKWLELLILKTLPDDVKSRALETSG